MRQEKGKGTVYCQHPTEGRPAPLKSGTHSNARCVMLEEATEASNQSLHQPIPHLVPQGRWAHGVPNLKPALSKQREENQGVVRNGVDGCEGG